MIQSGIEEVLDALLTQETSSDFQDAATSRHCVAIEVALHRDGRFLADAAFDLENLEAAVHPDIDFEVFHGKFPVESCLVMIAA